MNEINKKRESGWNLENSYANLPEKFFSHLNPTSVISPELIILNHTLAKDLGLDIQELQTDDGLRVLAGNKIPAGSFPLAQAYAGHQFGYFNMLGDGRALLLGEQITSEGKRLDIQLKGSGRTPYSRGGDGKAALGPMLREYIISEAMYALGIPTTRSLAVVTTGESIIREKELDGAVLTRVASSHIRVATFEYAAHYCSYEELKALADYTIQRHFPYIQDTSNRYLSFLKEVIRLQAELVSKWQLVGFIHGVMNTDNITIGGETIDYGPCAFMDTYDPRTVFSSIDSQGRYAYGNQPRITAWNLSVFAETLLPLLHDDHQQAIKLAEDAVGDFAELYYGNWLTGMREKLGLFNEEQQDEDLIDELLRMMYRYNADYTNTFLALTFDKYSDSALFNSKEFIEWKEHWQARLGRQEQDKSMCYELMRNSNPALIPRNHRVEEALQAATNHKDYSVMQQLLNALSNPYEHSEEQKYYSMLPPKTNSCYKTYCGT